MFNTSHQQQSMHSALNGGNNHQRFNLGNLGKHYQHHAHQPQSHQQQQHQEHIPASHGGNYAGHQHTVSGGGLGSHFNANHLQNGTPNNLHGALAKPPNEHWALQLELVQHAREMTMTHSHARTHPSVNKSMVAGTTNGFTKEAEKEERNRPSATSQEDDKLRQIWDTLDLSGQNLKTISPVFQYTFLKKLFCNNNKLQTIPPAIGRLRSLTHVDLSLNQIKELPAEIGMLSNLKQLLLFDNQLVALPPEIGWLYQLEMLGIEGNPLSDDIRNILMDQGTSALVKVYRETAPGKSMICHCV
jgi:CCR4-NOT transcription complex subunit 6